MLVYIALLTPVLLLFCGIAVDVGQLEVTRLQMQSASDAAALGAAQELERGVDNWVSDGQGDAGTNGFTNGSNNTTVSIAQQPTYGAYAGFYDAVQATVTKQVPLTFLSLLGSRFSTVRAQSTALVAPCAYVRGTANLATPALNISNGSVITTGANNGSPTCPWYINSSVQMDNQSSFSALAENVTGSAGASNWTVASSSVPRYNAQTMADPLASIVQPTVAPCTAENYPLTQTQYLNPGTYCNFSAQCQGFYSCFIVFNPGTYVFVGGMNITNGAILYGGNVTLYFTSGNGYGYGTMSFNNSALVMTPAQDTSSGAIPGITVMNSRNWTHTNAQDFVFSNGSYLYSDGLVYLSGTGLSLSSSTGAPIAHNLGLDVDNLSVSGSYLQLKSDFTTINGGSPFQPQGGLVQ